MVVDDTSRPKPGACAHETVAGKRSFEAHVKLVYTLRFIAAQ